jgi:hypothetical protein
LNTIGVQPGVSQAQIATLRTRWLRSE